MNQQGRGNTPPALISKEKADKALVLAALRAVLQDPEATTEQRLYAMVVLDNMRHYGIVPYNVKHPGKDSDAIIAEFARELEKRQEAKNK